MKITLLVAPYDSGHHRSGLGAGPEAILSSGLVAALAEAGHDVEVCNIGHVGDAQGREIATGFAVCRAIADLAHEARAGGRLPVTLAGNCLTAAGAIAGEGAQALWWFDQHGDLNTPETSAYGFLDGMALAVVLGLCWRPLAAAIPHFRPVDPARAVLVDARDLDSDEKIVLSRLPVRHITCGEAEALAREAGDAGPAHVHVDLDIHDPAQLRVNRYTTPGGPDPTELRRAVVAVARDADITGMTISAYDPEADPLGQVPEAAMVLILDVLRAMPAGR